MSVLNGKETFEIGLVMAGAISAGAYTAGVIDFLLQALAEWQQLKDKGEGPPHDVKIRVMSGASAGGMTSAITAAMLNGPFSPVNNLAGNDPPANNPLYDSWVKKIDIKPLLGSDDLRDNKPVVSLLDSTILGKIAHEALQFTPTGAMPSYISDELHLYLTVTNMRGVPYRIAFQGPGAFGHELSMRADHLHFVVGQPNPDNLGVVTLDPNNPGSPCWQKLQQAALATGAFPMGLAPRILSRPSTDYDSLLWDIPHPDPVNPNSVLYTQQSIKPTWPTEFTPPFDYDFICVDGGLMNNEPLELARRNLARGGFSNPRDPDKVNRAVFMIDPFPSEDPVTKQDVCGYAAYDIIKVFTSMFSSLKQQARFKPEELVLAQDEKVYSRWMIAPIRYDAQGKRADYPIASGMLGGFGGFLSEVFRRHDFQLGRRNCQKFLRETFVIPLEDAKKNPVFKSYNPKQFNDYKVTVNGIDCLQIIPVDWLPASKMDVPPLAWDKIPKGDWEDIQGLIKDRLDKVADRLVDTKLEGSCIGQVMAKLVLFFLKGKMKDSIIAAIEKDLKKYELIL
jgi:predicted acylesterase/phospholipase RssA